MRTHEIRQRLAANAREARGLLTAANGGELAGEARTRLDAIETESTSLEARLTTEERVAAMERQTGAARPIGQSMPDLANAIDAFNVPRWLAHRAGIISVDEVSREAEVIGQYAKRSGNSEGDAIPLAALLPRAEKRTLLYGAGSGSGAGLVFEQESPDAIPALRANTIVGSSGARILSGLQGGGPLGIPKIKPGATAAFYAEDTSATPNNATTEKVTLTPHFAIALMNMSKSMLVQTSPAAQEFINADILAAVLGAVDRVALVGGGAAEPSGIFATVAPTSMGEPTWENILAMIEAVQLANVPGSKLSWLAHPSAVRKLRSTPKVAFGSPPTLDASAGFIMDSATELADYAVALSTYLPTVGSPPNAAALAYCDMSQCVVGLWETANILVNPWESTQFARGGISIRATASCDVALRYDEAFVTRTIAI